jgi:site-specific DNA-cytosine methylase
MEKGLMDVAPLWNDLKTFPYESFHGLVDILIAGYPCQPFSSAGKRAGKEDPRHLWPWIADGIRLLQPRMCFFENVEGHISLGLSTVISDLEELGYKSSFGIFSASEVGAVHQRKRVFILAHRSDERFQGGKWFWQARAQGASSGYATECSSSMADTNSRRMSGSRNELGNAGEVGQGWTNTSQDGIIGNAMAHSTNWRGESLHDWNTKPEDALPCCAWPSRPSQPQYAWEPPRVVGNSSQLFCDGSNNNRGISEQGEQIPEFGNSSWETTMGNAECIRIPTSRKHGAMDEASGIPTDRERSESPQADSESSSTREREGSWSNASKCSEIEPEMGRDIDGITDGMDISELSGLCHSELAEIREWMVKGDNRTDELRSCGNGVVPATAERAFRVLMEELINK